MYALCFIITVYIEVPLRALQCRYNEYTHYLSYDNNNFIADFGGYLGLLLGSSLLTFYDLFKQWISSLWRCIKGMHHHQDSSIYIKTPTG